MACSMIKKGVLGAALGAGALYAAFGTSAPGYLRTAFHKARHNVKQTLPVQFEIDHARDQIAQLEPAIGENVQTLARAIVDMEHLDREVVATRANLDKERQVLTTLREHLNSNETFLAGNVTYTPEEVKGEALRRLDHYKEMSQVLKDKEETLKAKQKSVAAAREQLRQMKANREALTAKLAGIEARLKLVQTTQDSNEFNFDASALSRAKASVVDLEKRLDVMTKAAELEGRYAGSTLPARDDSGRDVVREMDAEFGPTAAKPTGTEKSL